MKNQHNISQALNFKHLIDHQLTLKLAIPNNFNGFKNFYSQGFRLCLNKGLLEVNESHNFGIRERIRQEVEFLKIQFIAIRIQLYAHFLAK
jgi:hypothetical protein